MSLILVSLIVSAGLLAAALFIVATVLVASRHSLAAWHKFMSALGVLIWVVPAAGVVAWFGLRLQPRIAYEHSDRYRLAAAGSTSSSSLSEEREIAQSAIGMSIDSTPASRPRLKVRGISSDDPKWTTASNVADGRELVAMSSERFATLAEAEANVTQMALAKIRERGLDGFSDCAADELQAVQQLLKRGGGAVVELVDRFAVKDLVGEVMDWDFKNGTTGKMYRAHLRLDFSPQFHDALQGTARAQLVQHRLWILGGIMGLITLMLATSAGYFKLDDATDGAYRRRLKLAAVAVIAAGSLATAQILGS